MSKPSKPPKEDPSKEDKDLEEKMRQALLIHKLAVRLPWIVLGISLFAFLIIFLQVLFREQ